MQPIAAGSPSVTITSDVSIINADQVLILNGNIQGTLKCQYSGNVLMHQLI